jgi:hypothetical protein
MTTADIAAIRARLYAGEQKLPQVAYSARDAAAALGVTEARVWSLIRDGELPARRRGQRRLISGAIILDILGKPHPRINDPRTTIDPDQAYHLGDLAALLGLTYGVTQRLVQNDYVKPDRHMGGRPLFYGRTILAFLNGVDEPMRASQSA